MLLGLAGAGSWRRGGKAGRDAISACFPERGRWPAGSRRVFTLAAVALSFHSGGVTVLAGET